MSPAAPEPLWAAPPWSPPKRPPAWAFVVVIQLAVLAYLPAFDGGFVYDDVRFIVRNQHVRDLSNAPEFLLDATSIVPENDDSWHGIYRPLRTFTFAVDYAIGELNPVVYHAQNVLWHVVAVTTLLWILARLGIGLAPALIATGLFAVHPVQVESVAWITSRGDVLSGALALLAIAIHLGGPLSAGRLASVATVLMLALLGKESAVVVPPLIVLLDLYRSRSEGSDRRWLVRQAYAWVGLFVVAGLYVWLRQSRMYAADPAARFGHLEQGWANGWPGQLVLAARGFLVDVTVLFFPIGRRLDFYPSTDPAVGATAAAAFLVLASIVALAARMAARFHSTRRRAAGLVAVGLLWFLVARLPTSNVLVSVSILNADRFLYLPLAGLALALGAVWPRSAHLAGVAVVLLLGVLAFDDARLYRDDETLWTQAAPLGSPRQLRYEFVAEAIRLTRDWEVGDRALVLEEIPAVLDQGERAIDRWSEIIPGTGQPDSYLHMAALLRLLGDRREAYRYLKRVEGASPDKPRLYYLMGLLLNDVGEYRRALLELDKSQELGFEHPVNVEMGTICAALADVEFDRGNAARAAQLCQDSIILLGETRSADCVEAFRRYLEQRHEFLSRPLPPLSDLAAWVERAKELSAFGDPAQAADILGKIRAVDPRNAALAELLARAGYEAMGEVEKARGLYREVLALDPDDERARLGLVRLDPIWADPLWRDPRPPEERLAMLEGLPEDDERVLVLRGLALIESGRAGEGRALLERTATEGHGPGTLAAMHHLWLMDEIEAGRTVSGYPSPR